MSKQEFLEQLRKGLSGLPQQDTEERLSFYSEMIDDRIEEGLSEDDAVREIGNVDEIVSQIVAETPLAKLVKEKIKPKKRLKVWEILLIVLGFPIWFSLAVAAFAVILSVYAVIWAVIICLWAVFVSLIACSFAGIVAGVGFVCNGNALTGTAVIGAGIVCSGLAIFMFYGCKAATKGALILTKKLAAWVKNCFIKKEGA